MEGQISIHAFRIPGLPRRRCPRNLYHAECQAKFGSRGHVCRPCRAAILVCPAREVFERIALSHGSAENAFDGRKWRPIALKLRRWRFIVACLRLSGWSQLRQMPSWSGRSEIAFTSPVLPFKSCMLLSKEIVATTSFLCIAQPADVIVCNFVTRDIPQRGHPAT